MKFTCQKYLLLLYFFLILDSRANSYSQPIAKTIIKGTVLDAKTKGPLPFVSVLLKNTTVGTVTDDNGKYYIETSVNASTLAFSFVSYETQSKAVAIGKTQVINISLNPSSYALGEVIVKPAKEKYSNKNNPAVELIQKVIDKKSENRIEGYDYLQYNKYEKTQFALSKITDKNRENLLLKKFQFLLDNIDTVKQPGKQVLPFFIKESLSTCYFRKTPFDNKEVINGEKTINFEEYIDNNGVSAYINYLYQNINIYDNNIMFLTNKFLSPIANNAPLFYRYYIQDTIKVDDINCIRLFFEARNKADFLFQGVLLITQDSTFAIKKIDMNLNRGINLDWVKNVRIVQDFYQPQKKKWMLETDDIAINFEITKKIMGLYGERTVSYRNHVINEPINDSIFKGQPIVREPDRDVKLDTYWEINRPMPLTKTEKGIYTNVDSLKKIPAFKLRMDIIMILSSGYKTYKYVEIGQVGSFVSFNTLEGWRFKYGVRTTTGFSKKITLDGYVAYGINDRLYKYSAGLTYSLTSRTIYQFPVKSIRLSYQNDTQVPGQNLQFLQSDNIFTSFKRGVDDKMFYNKSLRGEFLNEFNNHFSFTLGFNYLRQTPRGNLYFIPESGNIFLTNKIQSINIPEVYLSLRYAPKETFYQGKSWRGTVPSIHPVIMFRYTLGSKALGNDYDYSRLQVAVSKRFYPYIIGYTDISVEAGKIFGKVPYPLLFIHNANQTITYQANSYNLMNFLEFVSDEYASLNIDYCFNGFIFNKIPFLKSLKLREIVTFKALYGGVSSQNTPSLQNNLFKFPTENNPNDNHYGERLTFTLEKKPYIEAGLGLSNILKIFRLDLVGRFTFTDNPHAPTIMPFFQFRIDI
jgi:hypothetical protein